MNYTKNNFSHFSEKSVRDLSGVPENPSPIFVHLPCIYYFLFIFTNCPQEAFWPILYKMDFRKFRKKCKMLSIAAFKHNVQKTIFPIFPKIVSGTCRGSPRTLPRFWCICPVFITFCSFLSIVPVGHFDQFWPKCIFENFEKNAKC